MNKKRICLYTDGACSGNPGIGGWSCLNYNAEDQTICDIFWGKDDLTTNNRMEILGLLQALELAIDKYKDCDVTIYSDSAYVVNMFNDWITKWASNNWIGSSKQEVKNLDLVKQLYEYKKIEFPNFGVYKVKGHNNELGNELADAIAIFAKIEDTTKLAKILKENNITLIKE